MAVRHRKRTGKEAIVNFYRKQTPYDTLNDVPKLMYTWCALK